jgi:twinfilin-like protein
MSHQTGILPNQELRAFCNKVKQDGSSRVIKVSIVDEQLTLDEHREAIGKWEEDYYRYVIRLVQLDQPCYLLFRFDARNAQGVHEWLLILWNPDSSPVKEKMLYASTKASFKIQFGSAFLVSDYFASTSDELSLASYKQFLARKKKEANGEKDETLMTAQELDLLHVRREEALVCNAATARSKTMPSFELPITDDAFNALFDLKEGLLSYVQLSIDLDTKEIVLGCKEGHKEFEMRELPSKVPEHNGRYHLILFPHHHENAYVRSIIFVYSVGRSGCTVRERMMYSTSKSGLLSALTDPHKFGIEVTKKMEIDDPDELQLDNLLSELHPKQEIAKPKFDKPKGPAGKRGGKRIIRDAENGEMVEH